MSKQQNIPGTGRKGGNTRLEKLSEELREQLTHNAAGRAREKELRKQILTEVIGVSPEAKELLEQLLALPTPAYRYVDGEGIEMESAMKFDIKAVVHPTGEQEPAVGEGVKPPAPRKAVDKKKGDGDDFDEDSIPDPDDGEWDAADVARTQADAGVAENEDGDVVPPEKSAPKKRGAKKPKAKGKRK